MEDAFHLLTHSLSTIVLKPLTPAAQLALGVMLVLFVLAALISGSEIAFFSLETQKLNQPGTSGSSGAHNRPLLRALLANPQHLLSTILISSNFLNIAIVLCSSYFLDALFDFSSAPAWVGLLLQILFIALLILAFGELLPKIYASYSPLRFASFMAYPLYWLGKLTYPFGALLIASSDFVNKRVAARVKLLSVDDLSHVIDISRDSSQEEREMLESVVRFSNIDVKSIMCPRIDVVAVEWDSSFDQLRQIVRESGFSRIPVYQESFDEIKGILYAKDLLMHLDNGTHYDWHTHLRPAYFVPESKKIKDLLTDFQRKRMHIAVVIDEYGGTSGIVTLEDVIEEIMGEIKDELDELEVLYTQIDERTYSFEAKTLIHDFCKVVDIDQREFDDVNADTLAGLVLEMTEEIPSTGESFQVKHFLFTVEQADERRIIRLRISC